MGGRPGGRSPTAGTRLLREGTDRIYGFAPDDRPWDGRWLVMVGVPANNRPRCATAAHPAGLGGPRLASTARRGSPPGVDREQRGPAGARASWAWARAAGPSSPRPGQIGDERSLARTAWDLDAIERRYEDFLDLVGRPPAPHRPAGARRPGAARPGVAAVPAAGPGAAARVAAAALERPPGGRGVPGTPRGVGAPSTGRVGRSDERPVTGTRQREGEPPCSTDTCSSTRTCTCRTWPRWPRPGSTGRAQFGRPGSSRRSGAATAAPTPPRSTALFAAEGVDVALLFCEYSPKATGYQLFDDLLPLVEQNPRRFRPVANVNPHLHYPITRELERQLDLGAAALKIHPVHGGFRADDAALYPAYAVLVERGVPLVVHCGTSSFPGSTNAYADPRAARRRPARLPRPERRPRARRPRLVVRRRGVPGADRRTSGSSSPGCRPSGCPSTTPATT